MGHGPAWTKEELALVANNPLMTASALAEKLGRTRRAVLNVRSMQRRAGRGEAVIPQAQLTIQCRVCGVAHQFPALWGAMTCGDPSSAQDPVLWLLNLSPWKTSLRVIRGLFVLYMKLASQISSTGQWIMATST